MTIDQLQNSLKRQSEIIAALRNEVAEKDRRIKVLESKNAQQILTIKALAQSYKMRDEALKASQQCITDFLDVYGRHCSMLILDEAVKSLRNDALRLVNKCLSKDDGELYAEGCKP